MSRTRLLLKKPWAGRKVGTELNVLSADDRLERRPDGVLVPVDVAGQTIREAVDADRASQLLADGLADLAADEPVAEKKSAKKGKG